MKMSQMWSVPRHRTSPSTLLRMAFTAALAALLFSCSREPAPRGDAEVVVAEVNGARITLRDLKNEIASRRGLSPALSAKSASRGEISDALRLLIDRTVVIAEGERLGVSVTGSEVEQAIDRFRADFPPGGLEKALVQLGMDMETWRSEVRRSLLYRKASEAIAASRAKVTAGEVESVFRKRAKQLSRPERIRLRQFLFDTEENAREARRMIQDGEGPEEVVGRFTTGDFRPATADLGYVTREDLPKEIAADLFALKEGEVSGVVSREQMFSLFLVTRKEPARTLTLAAAAPEIREELLRARKEEAFRSWLTAQVAKADVRVQEALLERFAEGKR